MITRILTSPALFALCLIAGAQSAHAQAGSLTPPAGAPTPTSRTLNEVYDKTATIEGQSTAQGTKIDNIQTRVTNLDSRKPLIAGTPGVTISANGSYYLTANKLITTTGANGIAIFSRYVTLDLNGFSLQCGSGTGGSAILIDAANGTRQIHICNGFIRGGSTWNGTTFAAAGWTTGISGAAADVSIANVTINGMRSHGINCAEATVSNCRASECGSSGIIAASVDKCRAMRCMGTAMDVSGTVSDSCGESVGTGAGVKGTLVSNSVGTAQINEGIIAGSVINSRGESKSDPGILAGTANNSKGYSFSGIGMDAEVATNCYASSFSSTLSSMVCKTASFCRVVNSGGGKAMTADVAIGCTTGGGIITSAQKHLGTP